MTSREPASSIRVLIVGNSGGRSKALAETLGAHGFSVVFALDPDVGYDMLFHERVGLIVYFDCDPNYDPSQYLLADMVANQGTKGRFLIVTDRTHKESLTGYGNCRLMSGASSVDEITKSVLELSDEFGR